MSKRIVDLKRLAREAELEVLEKPEGHFIVIGGIVNVHYWPNSKRLTAWAEGAPRGRSHMTPKQVIQLADKGEVQR